MEFALLSPLLGLIALGMVDVWSYAMTLGSMKAAVSVASSLYFQGASDDTAIVSTALAAWNAQPADAALTTSRTFKCGSVEVAAGDWCGSSPPALYVTIESTGTWTAPFDVHVLGLSRPVSYREVLRVW